MQTHPGACTPERLRSLQTIFDAIWLELEAKHSKLTFPWEAQAARYRLAARVLSHANDLSSGIDQIKREILQQLDDGKKPSLDRPP